jgi:hypothetical protein
MNLGALEANAKAFPISPDPPIEIDAYVLVVPLPNTMFRLYSLSNFFLIPSAIVPV